MYYIYLSQFKSVQMMCAIQIFSNIASNYFYVEMHFPSTVLLRSRSYSKWTKYAFKPRRSNASAWHLPPPRARVTITIICVSVCYPIPALCEWELSVKRG